MPESVKIVTLGCSKNTVDSEKLLRQLQNAGFSTYQSEIPEYHDIVIVNTCGFINDAKEESVNTILELVEAKKRKKIGRLFVMGCLSERYMNELRREIPEVDSYFGVNKPEEILRSLQSSYHQSLDNERILTGPPHYAYLKVSEGCNRNCSFCAIPGIRGRYTSKPSAELVEEAQILAGKGVKEMILIAQDLSYYGKDIYGKPTLSSLCNELLEKTDIEWLRLHYLYPGSIPDDLLPLMKSSPRICNYIDIPVQHISNNILSRMKRNHSEYETRKLLSYIRNYIPEAAIRTTLITGFPGETEDDFKKLLDFVGEFRFNRLGVFTYSHEEATPAYAKFNDDVPEKIKRERADEIMLLQQGISLQNNLAAKGKEIRVIIDSEEEGYYSARSEYDSPEIDQEIHIKEARSKFHPGDFCNIRITGATEYDLKAIISE